MENCYRPLTGVFSANLKVDTVEETHPSGNSLSISTEDSEIKLNIFCHVYNFCLKANTQRRQKA